MDAVERIVFRGEVGPESPFWTEGGEMIDCVDLGLSHECCAELAEWVQGQWDLADDTPEAASWDAAGRDLFDRVRGDLAGRYELVWDDG